MHQDALVYAGLFKGGQRATHDVKDGRGAWVHVVRGEVDVNGETLRAGDAAAVEERGPIAIAGRDAGGEVLVFDVK
jgi:redox-sensitive bicupin YhaK (pirin superfamily)